MTVQTPTKNIIPTITDLVAEINATDVREKYVIVCKNFKNKHQLDFMHIAKLLNASYSNINLELSRILLDVPKKKIPFKANRCLEDIINSSKKNIILLDRIEILFDPLISIDPLYFIESNSKQVTLIVNWPGEYNSKILFYANPGHPEYKSYTNISGRVISVK
ncbi:BREX-3 system P-loop-containing protein BrxF [Candidatus Pacearchaeota archaeon]|nr:BREX-3 system P-loop-containing protein BrxF [Candidatus Pacearchaeota archaeon]